VARPQLTEVTDLLKAWSDGDEAALDRLAAQVYRELHGMARRYIRNEQAANTLQTTALAYLSQFVGVGTGKCFRISRGT